MHDLNVTHTEVNRSGGGRDGHEELLTRGSPRRSVHSAPVMEEAGIGVENVERSPARTGSVAVPERSLSAPTEILLVHRRPGHDHDRLPKPRAYRATAAGPAQQPCRTTEAGLAHQLRP